MKLDVNRWRQRLRDAANRTGLLRFWRWWTGELALLMPGTWRAALQRRFTRPVIEFADGEAIFWRPEFSDNVPQLTVVERVSLIGDAAAVLAAGRAAVARLAAKASGGIAMPRVAVALGPRQVLRKELALPAAVEDNLAQTLAYDLDRHTPFRPEQLYFDAAVIGRDGAKKMLRVDWVAALKTVVDDACRQVGEWGAVAVSVIPGPPTANGTRLNVLPGTARTRPLHWRRWQVLVPLAVVATVALAAVVVPLVQKRQYAIALLAANAEAARQAEGADAVRQQLDGMQNEYNYILARKYAYPSNVRVLDEVTRVLPDDTWLTQFELKTSGHGKDTQRDMYLRGETADAGKLIALLEDSKVVEQAAPRSPTTKIQGASGEVFDLSARLRTLAPPERVAVTPAEAPAAVPAARGPANPPPERAAAAAESGLAAAPPAVPPREPNRGPRQAVAAPAPGREAPAGPQAAGFGPAPNAYAGPGGAQRQRAVPSPAAPPASSQPAAAPASPAVAPAASPPPAATAPAFDPEPPAPPAATGGNTAPAPPTPDAGT